MTDDPRNWIGRTFKCLPGLSNKAFTGQTCKVTGWDNTRDVYGIRPVKGNYTPILVGPKLLERMLTAEAPRLPTADEDALHVIPDPKPDYYGGFPV